MIHTFYLGAPEPVWLERFDVPMMVSRRRFARRKSLPRARGPVLVDSSGFTEILQNGCWTVPARQYADEVQTYVDEVGNITGAAIQDWMCESVMLQKNWSFCARASKKNSA